ncbi:hybrid sensor histidine kinase/response regulator transcription factor [Dyadobacter chenhuakuii]|uniref:histidine kinase n=1 Tax=Dyadobacter chenhuakuii TaxID=2909339 RepID=A0ABY4XNV6_9BACT|nr:two-component regulator propeller domain-containing protein [Dyadobacter chenhuakuii]MCF2494728.1 response regulator [Dyadobacter chenhuakuii]USJ31951.1 response regulator [Dyadobacter chenhuakuii]
MKGTFLKNMISLGLFCLGMFPVLAAENGRVLRYSLKEGLSFGIVNSIVQDKQGLMWLATGDGLNRFDGTSFKVFKNSPDDKQSLSGNYVKSVFCDRDGTIWTSSRNGLNKFIAEKEIFQRHTPMPDKGVSGTDVSDISQARDGNLWISLNGAGFALFDKKAERFTYYNKQNLPKLNTNAILSAFEDSKGMLWLGTRESGIDVLEVGQNRKLSKANISLASLPATRINSIYEDHLSNIWIASAKGLILFKRNEARFYVIHLPGNHRSDIYLSLRENHRGQLLVGVQDGGLYSLDLTQLADRKPEAYSFEKVNNSQNEGITQRSVQTIYMDADRNIWLGTYGEGVYLISSIPEKFKSFEKKIQDSRAESYLRFYGMCVDKDGYLWLGTDGDGIYKTKNSGEIVKHYAVTNAPGGLSDGAVIAAHRGRDEYLWFGTYSGGLFQYDPKKDTFKQFANIPGDPTSLSKNDVRVVYEDRKRNLWVGTNGGGLALLDRQTGKFRNFVTTNSSINSNDVRAIDEDSQGNLWIGTYGGGLNYLNVSTMQFRSFFNEPGKAGYLSNRIIFSLHYDAKERLWIGSEGNGLLVYDTKNGTTKHFTEKNGLANDVIYAFQEESIDNVWFSTNKGVSRINLPSNRIDHYDQSNGLQGGQFNPNSTLYIASSNAMVFGGTEGWNLFVPTDIKPSDYKPKVMITGLQLFGQSVAVGAKKDGKVILEKQIADQEEIVLQPSQSVFTIQYTALNYAYPDRNQFAYKLEGLDQDWNYVQNERSATYRYLPPGDYVFKVKSANQDGVWFENEAGLHVRVLPPWYQTWWAYLLYMGIAALVIYYYQQYKIRQARLKYEVQMAHFETQKEKELNEKKLAFFTHISHEFRTPLTLIINPVKELLLKAENRHPDQNSLNIVYRNAKRLLSMVDQLLLFRKADREADKLNPAIQNITKLALEVFQCFTHQAEQKHINYQFISPNEDLELVADREKIEIALFNLVSNAVKYTPKNGSVTLEIIETGDQVQITVSDSGPGIPTNVGDSIFSVFHQFHDGRFPSKGGFGIGLFLTKTFIESHFGSIHYESVVGSGTVFKVLLWKAHPQLVSADLLTIVEEGNSVLLEELSEDGVMLTPSAISRHQLVVEELSSDVKTMLIVEDDADIRQYIGQAFAGKFKLLQAENGEEGILLVRKHLPDIVISDVFMDGISGIDMCSQIKSDITLSHIPVILLTASTSQESRLKGIEGGADDYISKPFDKALLMARVDAILKSRNDLQRYFYNEITLQANDSKISSEYKEFLKECIRVVENHLTDPDFSIKVLAAEIGMSHSTLYNRIKSISGQSTNSFIRFIRLRRAAQILITTDITISEVAYQVGINDIKYFREQFYKLFEMKPSEYVKKYRNPFHENFQVNRGVFQNKLDN